MVQVASLIGEITTVKNELEQLRLELSESELSLSRALVLLESCANAIGTNCMSTMEQVAGSAKEFLEQVRK